MERRSSARPASSSRIPTTRVTSAVVPHEPSTTVISTDSISAPSGAATTRVCGASACSMVRLTSSVPVVLSCHTSRLPGSTDWPLPSSVDFRAQSETSTPATCARAPSPTSASTSEGRAVPDHSSPEPVAVTSTGWSTRLSTSGSRTTTRWPGSAVKVAVPEVPRLARNQPPTTAATRPRTARRALATRGMSVLTSGTFRGTSVGARRRGGRSTIPKTPEGHKIVTKWRGRRAGPGPARPWRSSAPCDRPGCRPS